MTTKAIIAHARVLGLRLRLGLVDLKTVESWADEAILSPGAPAEMADLCLATRAGERITSRILSGLGGAPSALDVMRAIAVMRVDDASQDEMRRLADNLDPIVREVDAGEALPTLMKPLLSLARDFWQARMISSPASDSSDPFTTTRPARRSPGRSVARLNMGGSISKSIFAAL